jgi:hypothetical protein
MWVTVLTPSRHVTSCTLVEVYCRFEWTYCLCLQDRTVIWSLIKQVRINRERCFALSPIHSAIETDLLRPLFPISVAPDLTVTQIGSFQSPYFSNLSTYTKRPFQGLQVFHCFFSLVLVRSGPLSWLVLSLYPLYFFHAWLTFLPWRWRQHAPPKRL